MFSRLKSWFCPLRAAPFRNPSLKKSAFLRLMVITFAAVLVFYAIGLSINVIGVQNVRNDMQEALQTHAEYAADQLNQDLERLKFFILEMNSDKQVLRFAFSHAVLTPWERQSFIKSLSAQEYLVKRSSDLVSSVQILFPQFARAIVTEQAQYADLDRKTWEELFSRTERGKVTFTEWNGSAWLLISRYDGSEPLMVIAFSVSPERLSARLEQLGTDQKRDLVLVRPDGSVFAAGGEGRRLYESREANKDLLTAEARLADTGLTLWDYTYIDEAMAPFAHYRRTLWLLTALALGLLGTYLVYYRRSIARPLNDLFDSMRQVELDGRYRIEAAGNSDYDDLYAEFNHMVDHLEQLSGQVYEERYRAQRAELKQLQMQIDPHFLYNTLYLIYRMAQTDGNRNIAHLAMNLSNYYRYITKMPEQVVRLRDEIAHVMNYLEIQRIRFSPRIRIEVDQLPAEIADEPIPSLIIQPIVENAFQHGVKDLDKDGLITLKYQVNEESFQVTVADNSGKMDQERAEMLWHRLNDPEDGNPSALRNLYRRLQLYEGADQVLDLKSVNKGLTATLTFQRKGGRE